MTFGGEHEDNTRPEDEEGVAEDEKEGLVWHCFIYCTRKRKTTGCPLGLPVVFLFLV